MKDHKNVVPSSRRGFLKLAGASAIGAGSALVADVQSADAAPAAHDAEPLYRETEHIKAYYRLARL